MSNTGEKPLLLSSREAEITLSLLSAVEGNSALTQRSIANELGIAVGLINAYLKRCVRKGYVKVRQVPKRRYAYYLTPTGFAEKSRLTARFLSQSFLFFREAREQCLELLEVCRRANWTSIGLVGTNHFTEIATLCARDVPIEFVGVIDDAANVEQFCGLPVVRQPSDLERLDAVLFTALDDPQRRYDSLARMLPLDRILLPALLKIRHTTIGAMRDRAP